MTIEEALEILGRGVPSTLRDDNLSYDQVQYRNAYRIVKEFVDSHKWQQTGERQRLPRSFDV